MSKLKSIEFDLLSNAKDSLRQAVELLAIRAVGSEHAQLKHAIVSVAHCIELLLKERVRRIHPSLVWENVEHYGTLEGRTITADRAVARLKSVGGVDFLPSDERILRSLRMTRNAIEHYEWRCSPEEAKVILGQALSFVFAFAQAELGLDLQADFRTDDTWEMLLDELHQFAVAHGDRIEARLAASGDCAQCCDGCGQMTIPMRGGGCAVCGHWQMDLD